MIQRAPKRIGAACAAIALVAICGTALAYFSTTGTGTAAAAVTQLTTPTITAATAATGGTVALTWQTVAAPGSGTVTYYVTRNGGEPDGNCPGAEEPGTAITCTDSGLSPGTYQYKVTALFHTWSKTSAVANATVTVGPVAKFAIVGTPTTAAAGASINLTITAQDEAGGKVTTFTGTHSLVFSGAGNGPIGTAPNVSPSTSTTGINFGAATPLTFATGSTTVTSGKNGVLKIYKPGEAAITATEGSLTTPVPLNVTITPAAASKFTVTAASAAPTAGSGDNLTITAFDAYGNLATSYTGSHSLIFSGAVASPSPNNVAPTVDDSSGNPIAFGTATPILFNAGVAVVSEGANGEMILYKAATAAAVKAADGAINGTTSSITPVAAAAASFTTTVSLATEPTTTGFTLVTTAKDAYGNTATGYTGPKSLVYTGTGAGTETSPGGSVAGVANSAGTVIPLGTATAITFTNGVATSASSKNGYVRLYKPGSASISVSEGAVSGTVPALTVTIGTAKRLAFTGLTVSAGTIGSPCYFTCAITTLGNSGTVTSKLMVTDEYGNLVSNVGASKTATITVTAGSPAGTISGSPLSFPETGQAISPTAFTFTAPATGSYTTNTITATSTSYTPNATITASK